MFLLGYTFWTRVQNKYWNSYRRKFRDSYGPKIFAFLEGNAGQSEADALINKLNRATRDISFFLAMLKEMIEIVKGEEREKLNILIEHPRFIDFFQKNCFPVLKGIS
ncbi:hypothetical protein [Fodinibius sediminis]|nr:hypothetical protein [Fodinibius sediminis]